MSSTPANNPSQQLAILFAIVAAVSMATIGVFSRITELPAVVVTFYRLFLGAGFMALWIAFRGGSFRIIAADRKGIALTGAYLAGFIICYIEAMNRTLMANAILIVYLAPIAATLFNRVFFGETVSRLQMIAMTLALCGFVVMQDFRSANPQQGLNSGLLYAALAMLFYAAFIIQNRYISGGTPSSSRTFWQLLVGALCVSPFLYLTPGNASVPVEQLGWVLLIGFLPGFIAIYAAIAALEKLPTPVYGTITYLEPVSVILFGWILFSETLSWMQLGGVALILVSGIGQIVISKPR